jgi:hypothetical protein
LILAYDFRDTAAICSERRPHVLWIHPFGKRRRTHQIAEHHRQVASLGFFRRLRFRGWFDWFRFKCRDGAQHLAAMPQQDPELLEVLLRQIADDREVNGVLVEALGVLSQADRC